MRSVFVWNVHCEAKVTHTCRRRGSADSPAWRTHHPQTMLDVFRVDPSYEEEERKYAAIAKEILGEEDEEEEEEQEGAGQGDGGEAAPGGKMGWEERGGGGRCVAASRAIGRMPVSYAVVAAQCRALGPEGVYHACSASAQALTVHVWTRLRPNTCPAHLHWAALPSASLCHAASVSPQLLTVTHSPSSWACFHPLFAGL